MMFNSLNKKNMAHKPSINGILPNATPYNDNSHSGLETERRVRTNNPPVSTPSPRGHA